MKKIFTKAVLSAVSLGIVVPAFAGNKDRSGQAGATEMLINPWAQSTGLFGMDAATVKGIQAMKVNIAGLSFTDNMEVGVSHTRYLSGSGISVNNAGIAYRVGESAVLGVNAMSMSFGDIPVTTIDNPEPGPGTAKFNPSFINVSVGFAMEFSHSIRGGVSTTLISEQVSNMTAMGASVDAGVQYVTGKRDNLHIGIALRNAGTNMRYSGGGFAASSESPYDPSILTNRLTPTEKFQLPTYMTLGFGYDFYLDENKISGDEKPKHRLTAIGNFQSNSFNNDYLGLGAEYAFIEQFMFRAAYRYEKDINNTLKSTTFYTGLSFGATISQRLGKSGPLLALDYSFRPTQKPANGVHVFGLRFNFQSRKDAAPAE